MSTRDAFLAEIEAFLVEHEMSATKFGIGAINDGKLLTRLRRGTDVTLDTADRVRRYMDAVRKQRPKRRAQHASVAA